MGAQIQLVYFWLGGPAGVNEKIDLNFHARPFSIASLMSTCVEETNYRPPLSSSRLSEREAQSSRRAPNSKALVNMQILRLAWSSRQHQEQFLIQVPTLHLIQPSQQRNRTALAHATTTPCRVVTCPHRSQYLLTAKQCYCSEALRNVFLRRGRFARLRWSDPHPFSTLSTTACGGGVHLWVSTVSEPTKAALPSLRYRSVVASTLCSDCHSISVVSVVSACVSQRSVGDCSGACSDACSHPWLHTCSPQGALKLVSSHAPRSFSFLRLSTASSRFKVWIWCVKSRRSLP